MLTISSDTLSRYGLNRIFRIAKEAGFDGVDIVVTKNMDTRDAEYLKELSEKHKMPITSLQTDKETTRRLAVDIIRVAKQVGVPLVIFYPPKFMDFKYSQWLKKDLQALQKRSGITIAMMNAPVSTFFGFIPERAMNSFNELKQVGALALDISNLATQKLDIMRVFEHFKKDVVTIFLSNYHKGLTHMPPEEGTLPLESFLTKLKKAAYRGNVSVKIRPAAMHSKSVEDVVDKLKRIKEYYDKYFVKS